MTQAVQDYARQFASIGGKARARKYDKATLSQWAKLGGRPRKPQDGLSQQGKWARIRRDKQRAKEGKVNGTKTTR